MSIATRSIAGGLFRARGAVDNLLNIKRLQGGHDCAEIV
jgi:hypothetical protein